MSLWDWIFYSKKNNQLFLTNLVFVATSIIVAFNISGVISVGFKDIPIPHLSNFLTFLGWSPKKGSPTNGIPLVIASSIDCKPPCVTKTFTFGCPK